MKKTIFNEFTPVSKDLWHKQALRDLKGKDFEETLLWHTNEGIVVEPYYTAEDLSTLPLSALQQVNCQGFNRNWQNRDQIKFDNTNKDNALIISSLKNGADSVQIDISGVPMGEIEFTKLFHNIKFSETPISFKIENNSLAVIEALLKFVNYRIRGTLNDDPIALFMTKGVWHENVWYEKAEVIKKVQDSPHFKVLTVNSHHFHNAGATAVQELAYTVSSLICVLDELTERGLSLPEIVQNIECSLSVGTSYFTEIAKVRALRFLFAKLLEGYDFQAEYPQKISIHCQTSSYYDSSLSAHNNMLRATTEAMSGLIGGCDALSVHAFNETFGAADDFGRRISRNVSSILKEESYFDKVKDPAAGSYFIENLTFQLAEKAWEIVKEVEEKGGVLESFKRGEVQMAIRESHLQNVENLKTGKKVMVGVNKFRDENTFFEKTQRNESNPENSNVSFELLKDLRVSEEFEK